MNQRIAQLALIVRNYDEAIKFYTESLDFRVVEDTVIDEKKRWVVITPPGDGQTNILLAKAANSTQETAIGNQSGGRVFLFLFTDNIHSDYNRYIERGIEFVRPLEQQPHGTVAVFKDLYGNLWDLIQPSPQNSLYQKL